MTTRLAISTADERGDRQANADNTDQLLKLWAKVVRGARALPYHADSQFQCNQQQAIRRNHEKMTAYGRRSLENGPRRSVSDTTVSTRDARYGLEWFTFLANRDCPTT